MLWESIYYVTLTGSFTLLSVSGGQVAANRARIRKPAEDEMNRREIDEAAGEELVRFCGHVIIGPYQAFNIAPEVHAFLSLFWRHRF